MDGWPPLLRGRVTHSPADLPSPPQPTPPRRNTHAGSDSLAGDRLGVFNLSSAGHAACVEYVRSLGVPLLLLGGGGYKIVNVSRCWAKETGVALGLDLPEALPPTEYYE